MLTNHYRIFISLFLIMLFNITIAQNITIDTLVLLLKSKNVDTNTVYKLNKEASHLSYAGKFKEALQYSYVAKIISKKIGFDKGLGNSYNDLAATFKNNSKYDSSLANNFKALEVRKRINDVVGIGNSYNNIGADYCSQGIYHEALKYYLKSLQIKEKSGNKKGMALSYISIGKLYQTQSKYEEAYQNYVVGKKLYAEIDSKFGMMIASSSIATLLSTQKKYKEALSEFESVLKLMLDMGHDAGVASTYNSIALIYKKQGETDKALKYFQMAINLIEKIDNKAYYSDFCINYGNIQLELGHNKIAEIYLNRANAQSIEIGYTDCIRDSYYSLSKLDSANKNYKGAYENYKIFTLYRDSLENNEKEKKFILNQANYDFEKREAVNDVLHKKKLDSQKILADEKSKKQNLIIFFVCMGLILTIIFVFFILRNLKITRKQKIVIEKQKDFIEEKHKEITDSINYAERIQKSFLATQEHLNENLREYFILFKPKDVVSGDFYWSATLSDGRFALVTADSTGHGVPGAIMSLLNITSLEKAIETLNNPSDILNSTRKTIIERLKKDGSEHGGKDGMDASLTVYDFKNKKLIIAAANNPVWIVRGNETIEIKADKMPVGKHDKDSVSFTQQEIDLQTGDGVYTLTDGFPDQFGGEKGKKFMSKNLRELLAANSSLSMHEQKQLLEKTFANWIGNLEQVDDVTIIGVRV
jgi:serine phosphatase RsbU (regulator of sigma subunit)/Tfp pilus assembly protein PilF